MTREEIMAMEAGRELDALIAEKVMNWQIIAEREDVIIRKQRNNYEGGGVIVLYGDQYVARSGGKSRKWNPSVDISAAWEIVERLRSKGFGIDLFTSTGGWNCTFHTKTKNADVHKILTAPEVICKAALMSVMES